MDKLRKWLTCEEAKILGLTEKENAPGRKKARYCITHKQLEHLQAYGQNILKVSSKTTTNPNDYNAKPFVLNAFSKDGYMMDIDEYCTVYKLPKDDITSYKLVSHTGIPYYNIVFKEKINDPGIDLSEIKSIIEKELKSTYTYKNTPSSHPVEGVLKWSDLHFGAYIRNLIKTPDYDSAVLFEGLMDSVATINKLPFKKRHVHICGDLIESFSGLNHINSWQSMDKNEIGSKAVMLCCNLLEKVLGGIENLGSIKIVAGNHDRISKANDEDVSGGAAELIAWGLTLKGFDVEFNPMIVTHLVDGINHIILHGHLGISKRSTTDIIWNYGKQGYFNLICEGHLHTIIEKLSVKQRDAFKTVTDDSVDHRRLHLQSFFTGNYYSESLGFLANGGYSIFWDNGHGKPQHLNVTK